jgi:transcriptional regulator GlxA family with amidase domain
MQIRTRKGVNILVVAIGVSALAFGAWIRSLPSRAPAAAAAPVPQHETEAALAALKPPKRARPLIAIVGINDATETNDYLMPYGILKRSGVADVMALATGPGPVTLYPVLTVLADATTAEFDARHPDGADYVVVPAMSRDDDPVATRWIRAQADKGAIVIGVCAGAKVVAAAGLLDERRATTHWYYVGKLLDRHPGIRYVRDRRFVVDRGVATTTGISAAMPMALTLIEAIGGRARAEAVGSDLGVTHWDARHRSDAFVFDRAFALTVMRNVAALWQHERLGMRLDPGIDEVSLALVADAWSRTYRSRVVVFADTPNPVPTREGMRIVPDRVAATGPGDGFVPVIGSPQPAHALDRALAEIAARYGRRTAEVVAMQLEYP